MKKLLPERKREKPQIIVTNLIDVILLLVFFFMVTSTFARDSKKLPIDLPRASSGVLIEGETLTFQVTAEKKVMLRGEQIFTEAVDQKVREYLAEDPNRAILIEADKTVDYGTVIQLLDVVRTAGGSNLGLSTRGK